MQKRGFVFYLVAIIVFGLFIQIAPGELLTVFKNAFGDALVGIIGPNR